MGRPLKLTKELQDRVCSYLRAGNYIETACKAAGIVKETLYRWLKRAAAGDGEPFEGFREAVEAAQAQAEVRGVALVSKAGQEDWRAAAWMLERKFPKRWGTIQRHEIGLSDEDKQETAATILSAFYGGGDEAGDGSSS